MTEAEWLAGDPFWDMPYAVYGRTSDRKLRLAGCAVLRHLWWLLPDARSRQAVEVAERFADGQASAKELAAARRGASRAANHAAENEGEARYHAAEAAKFLTAPSGEGSDELEGALGWALDAAAHAETSEGMAAILHCIFGNPFRTPVFSPEWRTDTAVTLAQQMYDSRDFSAMPILADALQDAGCDNAAILEHCRGGGPHVRGCWVVDLVLGKE